MASYFLDSGIDILEENWTLRNFFVVVVPEIRSLSVEPVEPTTQRSQDEGTFAQEVNLKN